MLKRYYTIDEAHSYLLEKSQLPLTKRDLFHLIAERRLRLCFIYKKGLGICDESDEWSAKVIGYMDFQGYILMPTSELSEIESLITTPFENQAISLFDFEPICIPFEQFDRSPIPQGRYFFCHSALSYSVKEYRGRHISTVAKELNEKGYGDFYPPDVHYHDLLIPAVDLEAAINNQPVSPPSIETPPHDITPAFCDNSHESYPTELHAALMLWEALYIKGEKNLNHPHQHAAKLWLEKNKDKLPTSDLANAGSNAMRDRLVTITTPSAKKAKK